MSFLSTLDRKRSCSQALKIAELSAFPILYPHVHASQSQNSAFHRRRLLPEKIPQHMENLFISALVRAGTCQKHALHTKASAKPSFQGEFRPRYRRRTSIGPHEQNRDFQAKAPTKGAAGAATAVAEITREEFKAIVHPYPSFSSPLWNDSPSKSPLSENSRVNGAVIEDLLSDTLGPVQLPQPWKSETEPEESLTIAGEQEKGPPEEVPLGRGHKQWYTSDTCDVATIKEIKARLRDPRSSHQELYDLYQTLPTPRAPYLDSKTLGKLLHHLAIVPRKTEPRMLRYLSILDDLKAAEIPISRSQYTSAIAFVGRAFSPVTQESVASAIRIYRTMEAETQAEANGTKSASLATHVTFTALFDIAAKSQKFGLAELVAREMDSRRLQPSRYFRVSRILYEGLRGDGRGVRRAYQELVDSGEIVDTVAINCVMSSLIRAGEAADAEVVFERMKRLDQEKRETVKKASLLAPPMGWRRKRDLAMVLLRATRHLQSDSRARNTIQDATPIAPDSHTYSLFLRYHAHTAGNIDRVRELLNEMNAFSLPIDKRIFKILFRGFALHGGVRYTSWKRERLERIWEDLLTAEQRDLVQLTEEPTDLNDDAIRFDSRLAWAVLSAYAQCSTQQRTLEIWGKIKDRWKPSLEDMETVHRGLAIKFPKHSI